MSTTMSIQALSKLITKLQLPLVMSPINSFVGVGLLTMPFCFKQCGIVLAILLLILCNILSRLACYFLIKPIEKVGRRMFVLLASHAFGQTGKFLAHLLIIGFMLGTCVANFIVIGDLVSQIISYVTGETTLEIHRILCIIIIGFTTIFPLGLRQNLYYLVNYWNEFTIFFYYLIAAEMVITSLFIIYSENWTDSVNYWRLDGIFQCLPIFFMASFCHIQMLEIYKMTLTLYSPLMYNIAKKALNKCTYIYIIVGLFGYICFYNSQSLTGNILLSFQPNIVSTLIQMGFILLIIFSFPLVIMNCRNSLNSLLCNKLSVDKLFASHLSLFRCLCLTILIIITSMIIAIRIPSLEIVLNIMGSTIGGMIFIFPAAIFIRIINSSNLSQRLLSYFVVIFGVCFTAFYMHANFYSMEESTNTKSLNNISSTLKDDIKVSIAKPMIDKEEQSAEEIDEAAVNSFTPREELKAEIFKTLNDMETSQEEARNNVHYFLRVEDKLIGLDKISEFFLPDRQKEKMSKFKFLEFKEESIEESIENCIEMRKIEYE
ncbi:putative sodium-coupled neutral amino acid transporter 10 [Nylanderia fulva]|uniref:putative sodium-coupled neutral amino acid transporter 10 n=1 Tax=Nylanderia fulva TaxID=613905 RepID=UPI0010FBA8EE|nr:putative sodium-coupled neutral amino acid transporter 10 [Nylanderia fulva]